MDRPFQMDQEIFAGLMALGLMHGLIALKQNVAQVLMTPTKNHQYFLVISMELEIVLLEVGQIFIVIFIATDLLVM